MRILHVIPSFVPAYRYGGPVRSVDGLARAQVAGGDEVTVFTTNIDGEGVLDVPVSQPVERSGVAVHYFGIGVPRRLFRSPEMARALARQVRDFDIVHVHSMFLWPTLRAARQAVADGVPFVLSPRGMLVRDLVETKSRLAKRIWLTLFDRKTVESAGAIHLTSRTELEELKRFGFRLPPLVVIPNGVDPPSEFGSHGPRSGSMLLYLGRLSWKKGLDRLLVALAHMPTVQLKIAGNDDEGILPGLWSLVEELGLKERVRFCGAVDGPEKAALLAAADLLVLPSLSENFGNVVVEAMAAGCPVVVTSGVGASDIVVESGAGVVAAGDPAALAESILRLLSDRERLRQMGEAGAMFARERLSWARIAERCRLELYLTTVPGAKGRN